MKTAEHESMQQKRRRRVRVGLGLFPACALALASGSAIAQEGAADRVANARAALEKWVEARSVLSKEKRDWAVGRELLQERIDLVKREGELLRGRIAEAEQSITEADKKREELVAENGKLLEASAALQQTVVTLEARCKQLVARLPDPIRERIKPLSQRLPEDPAATKLSLGERFQNLVGVLNEVTRFHREITVTSEVRTLADGSQAQVTALYLGLGQAYYATADGKSAGVGTPATGGWAWTPADADAPRIAAAIAILKNERVAEFVPLPIRIL